MWKCNNDKCGREFPVLGRISVESKPNTVYASQVSGGTVVRKMVEKACCPHCESIEFEEVKEKS